MSAPRQHSAPARLPAAVTVREILARDARALEVLEQFGIRLDPFTLIALDCTPEQLAEYSAVRRPAELRAALERFLSDAESERRDRDVATL